MALDLVVASVSLSMVAVLQNVDVLVVGRDNPAHSGAYAAVSVTSKAIVFGAIVLGGYLLPEAAIRWRQGGHALRQLAVVLVLLAVPSVVLLAVAVVAPQVVAPRASSITPTPRPPTPWPRWSRHDPAQRLGRPHHVPARRRPALGGGRVGGGCGRADRGRRRGPRVAPATAFADLAVQSAVLVVIVTGFTVVHRVRLGRRPPGLT